MTNVSALGYQGNANIGFTFEPTLSIDVAGDLNISNLTPGNSADSNTIVVSVATNTAYGYTLTSTVGNSSTYNNRNLNLVNSDISNDNNTISSFTSLDYGSSILDKSSLNDNTWGYSYSLNNGTTWQPYSGLPLYSDINNSTVLFSTYGAASSKTIDFKIAARASNAQPSGEYTNIINFYAVSNPEPPTLYDTVKYMTKGTLAENNVNLSDTITQANSGVYTYDPAVYGVASDASNDYDIYFYRGILDTDEGLGTYGSDGMADAWPNYVKLGNGTCWRIVRTTGSGGVKMIYNGLYGATTAGSCGNATANAQVATRAFNAVSTGSKGLVAVGYTFNSDYLAAAEDTAYGVLFGTNENYSSNSANSTTKDYLENTWFVNNMSSYESKLESSAGYCNDRSLYDGNNLLTNNDSVIAPYATASSGIKVYYFGPGRRNLFTSNPPSLTCLRTVADLYTDNDATNGNKQLLKPLGLLTADEVSFAGSGSGFNSKPKYHQSSFLCSGNDFLLLSPSFRDSNSYTYVYRINSNGSLSGANGLDGLRGVRPAISLMHHIQVTGGNGTATSPWTIE